MYKVIITTCSILLAISSRSLLAGEQKVQYSYNALPPGAIHPEGWLLDWAEAARDGITGHLDERSNTFKKGWSGEDFKAAGVKPHGTGWPLEQCAYWLDGLVRLAYILDDETLIAKAKSRLDPIVDAVNNGKGDSLIFWRPKSDLDDFFNNWAHSHMARALVAYYQASGDQRILDALVKVYRNYPLPDMPLDSQFQNVSGAVNLDPMIDTYLMSRDPQVLKNMLEYANRKPFADLGKKLAYRQSSGRSQRGLLRKRPSPGSIISTDWQARALGCHATTSGFEISEKRIADGIDFRRGISVWHWVDTICRDL